jgi:hypothetical protein
MTVVIGAALIALVAILRLAACGSPDPINPRAGATHATQRIVRRAAQPDAGEGAEQPGGGSANIPASVRAAARRALATYRARELEPRWRRDGVQLPALRPLVVAPAGQGRWSATAITRRGELYLVIDLEQAAGGIVVTALR